MAADESLNIRFRNALDGLVGVSETRMMGATCFMVNGHMVGAADRGKDGTGRYMFRVGKDNAAEAGMLPSGDPMMQGGRRMTGFYFVPEDACDDAAFSAWLSLALSNALSLPPK